MLGLGARRALTVLTVHDCAKLIESVLLTVGFRYTLVPSTRLCCGGILAKAHKELYLLCYQAAYGIRRRQCRASCRPRQLRLYVSLSSNEVDTQCRVTDVSHMSATTNTRSPEAVAKRRAQLLQRRPSTEAPRQTSRAQAARAHKGCREQNMKETCCEREDRYRLGNVTVRLSMSTALCRSSNTGERRYDRT